MNISWPGIRPSALILAAVLGLSAAHIAQATVVEVRTVMGNFQVNLFDTRTPKTVENFLGYVNSGAYFNNVVHRLSPNFVVQAGGYQYSGELPLDTLNKGPVVENEPELSNVRGTIAMAKVGGKPDSATSEWFINLADNSANLDLQNGGFTVFGQVLGDGMDVVDSIAALSRFNKGAPFNEIPLRNYSATDHQNDVEVTGQHLVLIQDIVVIDATPNTHPELQPKPNTLIDEDPASESGGSGGGSLAGIWLAGILLAGLRRRFSPS